MRLVMGFEHVDDDGDTWQYQVMELPSLGRLQLWFKQPGQDWVWGHSKEIPAGSTAEGVANLMRLFVQGELSYETYNQVLPLPMKA
ncbi:hypothetical protein JF714_15535 [Mycobacterium avium]|uniref:hypothetical protein n=1 Tax=Mycobacterium avium TaxID=1764 RepID=UPI001CDADD7B|nr:hypothetical protein [Mycobacterium avium]MCA2331854.1 hypothetical protein [Mycobacterium avium]